MSRVTAIAFLAQAIAETKANALPPELVLAKLMAPANEHIDLHVKLVEAESASFVASLEATKYVLEAGIPVELAGNVVATLDQVVAAQEALKAYHDAHPKADGPVNDDDDSSLETSEAEARPYTLQ